MEEQRREREALAAERYDKERESIRRTNFLIDQPVRSSISGTRPGRRTRWSGAR
jgi:hypothetical protein